MVRGHGAVNVRLSITELAKWMTCWLFFIQQIQALNLTKARKIGEIERLRLIGCQYINCAYTMDSKEEHPSPQIGMESEKMKNWRNYIIMIYISIQFCYYICFYFSICIFARTSKHCLYLSMFILTYLLHFFVLLFLYGPC